MGADYYLDDRTLVMGHTLIRLKCQDPCCTVPSVFGGHSVTVAGSGALTLENDVQELTFEPGYIVLKESCLDNASSLKRLSVPDTVQTIAETLYLRKFFTCNLELTIDRKLQPVIFQDILRISLPMGEKKRLLPPALFKRPELEPVRCLMLQSAPPPAVICRDMRILFYGQVDEPTSPVYSGTLFDSRRCCDFISGRATTEEYTAVMEMIRAGDPGWRHPEAEKKTDLMLRTGLVPVTQNTCPHVSLAVCDKMPDCPGHDELFHLRIRMFREHLFFPSLRQIRHQGTDWWIYSRNYLTADANCPYLREDVGVFDRNGLVTDRKISEDVYAKYRFLSIL